MESDLTGIKSKEYMRFVTYLSLKDGPHLQRRKTCWKSGIGSFADGLLLSEKLG